MTKTLKFAAILTAALFAASQAPAQTFSATGSNGGTVNGQRECLRGGGVATCTTDSTVTGPKGYVATKNRTRQTTAEGTTTTVTGKGTFGRTGTVVRQFSN